MKTNIDIKAEYLPLTGLVHARAIARFVQQHCAAPCRLLATTSTKEHCTFSVLLDGRRANHDVAAELHQLGYGASIRVCAF